MRSLKILRNLHGRLVRLKTSSFLFGGHEVSPSSLSAAGIHSSPLLMLNRKVGNVIAMESSFPSKEVSKEQPAHESDKLVMVDQVFEAYKASNSRGPDHDSCVETLRKLQEIKETLFPIGVSLSKTRSYYVNRKKFLDSLVEHPIFSQVIREILEHRNQFSSEALTSVLWILCCFEVEMKSKYPQEIIEELLTRKNYFSLQALSTFYRCMRSESIYGHIRIAECFPLLESFLNGPISTVAEFRLLSQCVHRSLRILPPPLIEKYLEHVQEYCQKLPFPLEVTTLCLMLRITDEAQYLRFGTGDCQPSWAETVNLPQLIREVCYILEPRLPEMDEANMMSLYKFLHFSIEPPSFVKKACHRARELVSPARLDLMTIGNPRTHEERMWLRSALNNFLDECTYFRPAAQFVSRILWKVGYDPVIYDKYFSNVVEMLGQENQFFSRNNQQIFCSNEESEQYLEEDEIVIDDGYKRSDSGLMPNFLVHVHEYVLLRMGNSKTYTHLEFEEAVQEMILDLFANHKNGNAYLVPNDYARAVTFLLATNYKPLELDPSIMKNLDLKGLDFISTGAKLGNTDSVHVSSAVCKRSVDFYREDLEPRELIRLARINELSQKLLHSYSIYPKCVESLVKNTSWNDSWTARELTRVLSAAAFNYPPALERVSKFLIDFENDVSSECVVSFLRTSFLCGAENLEEAMPVCVRIIERDFYEIHPFHMVESALALCYHRALSKCIINRIYSDNFIGQFDAALQASYLTERDIWNKRKTFMALNRAVCLDKSEANVPWFNWKDCQEIYTIGGFCPNVSLAEEVGQILEERLGQDHFVRNISPPYGYYIDFVVYLNEDGKPLKVPSGSDVVAGKVAVVIQGQKDYTTNIRQLKGLLLLKNRHLEQLGYRVVNINPWTWYSLKMSERQAKVEHLMSCILKNTS